MAKKALTDKPKNLGGRPLLFSNADELQNRIDDYFENCDTNGKPYTIAGLAYWLEIDRQSIYNYEAKAEYFGTIKRARERILAYLEELLITDGKAGQIFVAKNYGYTDKIETENINLNHEMTEDEADAILNRFK